MNAKTENILRWVAIVPFFALVLFSAELFHDFFAPAGDVKTALEDSLDFAGYWLLGPLYLTSKYFIAGSSAGYAGIWVSPEKHKSIVYKIFLGLIALHIVLNILVFFKIITAIGFYYSLGRHLFEWIPKYIGISMGASWALKRNIFRGVD
jgi:hypothetical protein